MSAYNKSRRDFLKTVATTSVLSASSLSVIASTNEEKKTKKDLAKSPPQKSGEKNIIPDLYDGPQSPLFNSVVIKGNKKFSDLSESLVSKKMTNDAEYAPVGRSIAWGIPFHIDEKIILIKDEPVSVQVVPFSAKWLVFLHTSDEMSLKQNKNGSYKMPLRGKGQLNVQVADYVVIYDDGIEVRIPIRQRYQIGMFKLRWGEHCLEAVIHHKPMPIRAHHQQMAKRWGISQTRALAGDRWKWANWLWAWNNPNPQKKIAGFRFEPLGQTPVILSALTAGQVRSNPIRWQTRKKAVFSLPKGIQFDPFLNDEGLLSQMQLDLGQVISAMPRMVYPSDDWVKTYNNKTPDASKKEIIIEYTAHPEAHFHLLNGNPIPLSRIVKKSQKVQLRQIAPALQNVKIRVIEKNSKKPVAVKLHVHGESGEYLAPVDRHRIPNNAWFEDYSIDFIHNGLHNCTYISGETWIKSPLGTIFIEVSKGFEIKPVRKVISVTSATKEIIIEIEKALHWREKNWVTADTHVHFLSPNSALLEGAAEGINIVNLLTSQWGELFTNLGDFDGKTTLGSREAGSDGEYLVRVGTENRQHVLGHISLLGYSGSMITPLTTGGPEESPLGDPVEALLTEWAKQCIKQDGVVVLPHFPYPRLENAATIVSGNAHAVEMTSWEDLYEGIDPYSLADWYRYLNCGYFIAAVGGTDKMSAATAVGTVRTYAKITNNSDFTYDVWKDAVRSGHTFVTYGPLINFLVDGKPMGSRIGMTAAGGTVEVTWEAASVTIPMSHVELIVNGEVRESVTVSPEKGEGYWSLQVDKSSWLALLVRGNYPDKPEIIAAHTSPVMINVGISPMLATTDAVTILEQIEGAMAYLDSAGTMDYDKTYKRMRLVLQSAHRKLHNRMHQLGYFHNHTPGTDHPEHPK